MSLTAWVSRLVASQANAAGGAGYLVGAIFDKLDLPPSDADNRRVRAVLIYLTET